MSLEQDKVREIFGEALARTAPEERERFLADVTTRDPELRRQVDSLLLAHGDAGDFLRQNVITGVPVGEGPGSRIGRYKLLQQIGEGGFGVVFMAEQQEPVRRLVALKIIKAGMDTREVVARFEAERQALALMDHPNIARVLDGGATDSGRPYFVMDLVKGIPVTEFCDHHQLPTEARLRLFIQVCAALQHAHQKGVIHRDLKPSNVLVTLHDGEPVPKVIDFGISKAIGQRLTDKTLFTRFEQLIGTPAYMSPEQAEWSGLDIDTRSDIYSLGVLLYELLTGTTPLEKDTLARAAFDEMRRMIREAEPPNPSTRLTALVAANAVASDVSRRTSNSDAPHSALRTPHSEVESVSLRRRLQEVRGELDWIVMKSLEKDRNRRYETVNALARDIERHLEGEPVLACPPSATYRASKFVRKHRVAVSAVSAVIVALIAGLVLALFGFAQARRSSQDAQDQAAIAKAINDFVRKDLLGASLYGASVNMTVREALDRSGARINERFTNQPLVEAAIRKTFGETYRSLGDWDKAVPYLLRAYEIRTQQLGPDHTNTLHAQKEFAIAYGRLPGRGEEGERILRQVAETFRRTVGPEHDFTLACLMELVKICFDSGKWGEAEEILRDLLEKERRLYGPTDGRTLVVQSRLASVAGHRGRYLEAVAVNEDVLRVERRNPNWHTPEVLALLANDYYQLADYPKAAERQTEQIELLRGSYGPQHRMSVMAVGESAHFYGAMGQWRQCLNQEMFLLTNRSDAPIGYAVRGVVAALLAGDTNAYGEIAGRMITQFAGTTNKNTAMNVIMVSLLRPGLIPDLRPVLKLAAWVPPGRHGLLDNENMAKGMAAYRRGDLTDALRSFEGWRRSTDSGFASLAGYFCAMIHHREGDALTAQAEMKEAGQRLDALAYSGELGDHWYLYGGVAVVRAEAERLILGREVSSIADAAWLEAARTRWAPVRRHLNEGDRLALEKKWTAARDEYLAAIREPVFQWNAAEAAHVTENSILANKIGITFLLANDSANHEQLFEQLFVRLKEPLGPGYVWHMLRTCLAGELNPSGELTKKADRWAAILEQDPGGVTSEAVSLIRTMAAYRSGRYQEAVEAAKIKGRLSVRNAAQIFRAMALAKLGRWEEGKKDLQQAETNLAKPLKNLSGDLWWDLAMCQLLLDEAHRLFNEAPRK